MQPNFLLGLLIEGCFYRNFICRAIWFGFSKPLWDSCILIKKKGIWSPSLMQSIHKAYC
jgi:hypothetical protein